MNTRGAGLVAQVLFEKLKPLKNYQNLSQWHSAFDLKDLLEINGITKQFNLLFSELDISPMNLKNEKEETVAWSDQGNYYIVRTGIDSTTGKQKFLKRMILERNGKMVKMKPLEKRKRKMGARIGSRKRKATQALANRKKAKSTRLRIMKGLNK